MKPLENKVPMLLLLVALAIVSRLSSLQTAVANSDDDDFLDSELEQHDEEQGIETDDDDDKGASNRQANRQYGRLGEAYERTCGRSPIIDSLIPDGLPRILGGTNAAYGEFPSYVRLKVGLFGQECGGTLVSDRHVLTANQCLVDLTNNGSLVAVLGDNSRIRVEDHELSIKGRKLCSSPRFVYETTRAQHDWVVIELSKAVKFNNYVQPACLPRWPPVPKVRGSQSKCYLVGMGGIRFKHKNFTDPDQAVPVPAESLQKLRMEQETCERAFQIPENDASRVCYARGDKNPGPQLCYGDMGGPILCLNERNRWVVVAVASMTRVWCGAHPSARDTHIQSIFVNIIKLLTQLDDACKLPLPSYKPRTPPPHVKPNDELRSAQALLN